MPVRLERVADVDVERVVHTVVATHAELVVETKAPGAVGGVDAQRSLNRVGVNHTDREVVSGLHTGDAEFEVSILVAEGRDKREIELRSNRPVARLEVTGSNPIPYS